MLPHGNTMRRMQFILRLATPVGRRLASADTPIPRTAFPILEVWQAEGWELDQVQSLDDLHAELTSKGFTASTEAA